MASNPARSSSLRGRCAMLSLLIDSDEALVETLQQQTKQARRETIRKKEIESARRDSPPSAKKPSKAEFAKIRRSQKQRDANDKLANHCYVVAQMIKGIAEDIEQLSDEKDKWFNSHDHLVDALARQHNVVDKFRAALSTITRYERRVINGALMLCELDNLLVIEKYGDWLRLRPGSTPGYISTNGRRLRAA